LRAAVEVGQKSHRETWSVRRRFTSSGIPMSKLRRPASTWATGTPSFTAASAPARVEFVSPSTITSRGRSSTRTFSSASSMRPVIRPWEPEPMPRSRSGAGRSSSEKKACDIARS